MSVIHNLTIDTTIHDQILLVCNKGRQRLMRQDDMSLGQAPKLSKERTGTAYLDIEGSSCAHPHKHHSQQDSAQVGSGG